MKSPIWPWQVVRAAASVEFLEGRMLLSGGHERAAVPALGASTAQAGDYTTLSNPNAFSGTAAYGISGNSVVGYYTDNQYTDHGFVYNQTTGTYTAIDDPNAGGDISQAGTDAFGISGSTVVGDYFAQENGPAQGFIYNGSSYATLNDPSADQIDPGAGTYLRGVSGNTLVGYYLDGNYDTHGFIYNQATRSFTTLDDPSAYQTGDPDGGTYAMGISGNNVVGYYYNGNGDIFGFIYNAATGSYRTLNDRNSGGDTFITGISGNNIVGYYYNNASSVGFIYNDVTRSYTPLNDPSPTGNTPYGISGNTIVGEDNEEGYIATPVGGISGKVFNDSNPGAIQKRRANGIADVTLSLQMFRNGSPIGRAATTTSDADGNYSFGGLAIGVYRVTQIPSPGQSVVTPAAGFSTVTLSLGQESSGNDFGDVRPTASVLSNISGVVFNDLNGDGIQERGERGMGGITVTLQKMSGKNPAGNARAATTDARGRYTFSNLAAGTYRVSQAPSEIQAQDPPAAGPYTIALAAGEKSGGNNFALFTQGPSPSYAFTTLHDPYAGSSADDADVTVANGMSGNLVVGYYTNDNTGDHGFIYNTRTGIYTNLDDPNANQTYIDNYSPGGTFASGISGDLIVGDYYGAKGLDHGFIYNIRTGTFTTLDDSNATQSVDNGSYAVGISGNIIIGDYLNADGVQGFYYNLSSGIYSTLDDPNATSTSVPGYTISIQGTRANAISGNCIVGNYIDAHGVSHGYLYDLVTGSYTTLDNPKAATKGYDPGTILGAISGATIVGPYGSYHGDGNFIYNGRTWGNLNGYPYAYSLLPDINGMSGSTLVGDIQVENNIYDVWDLFGFIAVPTTGSSHSSISGTVYNDRNGDGGDDFLDSGLAGITVSLQRYKGGNPVGAAVTTTTDASGHYSFNHLSPGTYGVTQTPGPHEILTQPAAGESLYTITLAANESSAGNDFGDHVFRRKSRVPH